ncbi:bifunctional trypsin-like peptidase domain-containing/SEL1-like repeat protein [Nocardia africana]|uniref:Predicted O-linked N-acetylglucosamine transferase, SPINDLY family n=1 Tax=Nocardia africana TaxID=134964 RepID=A0A378WP82_9NOCA|nr:bifunctional trypsin-like peptidase domain-containing/SEL1-like repeat protein [Nocardia africana]MCC3314741.1 bifunctional trypsin-like peptidase domain-containing/SEL1-like repeat protein [Nocardia africana]SUA42979.1 Predicted O-linked N-acetylglucosamine transferase, SPINDLY family [Nocardia africana]
MLAVDRAVLICYLKDRQSHSASGFRIDGEYILTADHCAEGTDYRVLIDGRNVQARVYLRTGRRDIDLAILKVDEYLLIERASCARIRTSHAARLDECCVLAFPEWKGNGRAQLDGYVPTGEAAVLPGLDTAADTSQLTFKCQTPPPASASRLAELTGDRAKKFSSQWRGASGGAIVHDGYLIGVLSNHVLPEGDSSLAFTPMTAVDGLSTEGRDRFLAVLGSTTTANWPIVPKNWAPRPTRVSAAETGSAAVVDLHAGPDAESESLFHGGLLFAEQNQLAQAEDLWRRAARQGHTGAMNNLANLLHARRKLSEAHDWYREAAARGNVEAMGNLAGLLLATRQVRDAENWWRAAAKAGNTDSMYNLAILLDKTQRFDEALTWYRRAAEANHCDAMHNLAIRLRYRGIPDEAEVWWRRAGHKQAQKPREKLRGPVSRTPSG